MRRGSTSVTTLTVPESEVQLRWVTADGRRIASRNTTTALSAARPRRTASWPLPVM